MGVGGSYLAFQLSGALAYFRVYRDSILTDAVAGFTNIEQRADAVVDAAFQRMGSRPGSEDSGDMSQEAEWAQDAGQAYYEAMTGLRQATINLLAAGLFHLLEQQLAKLALDRAFRDIPLNPRNANLGPKGDLLPWYKNYLGLDLTTLPQWGRINELRLVTGAVKHADGGSARELRPHREELFQAPALDGSKYPAPNYDRWPLRSPLTGEDLFVTEPIFGEYATAVLDFVRAIVSHFQQNGRTGYPFGG